MTTIVYVLLLVLTLALTAMSGHGIAGSFAWAAAIVFAWRAWRSRPSGERASAR